MLLHSVNFIAGGANTRVYAFLVSIAIIRVGNTAAEITLTIPELIGGGPEDDNTSALEGRSVMGGIDCSPFSL